MRCGSGRRGDNSQRHPRTRGTHSGGPLGGPGQDHALSAERTDFAFRPLLPLRLAPINKSQGEKSGLPLRLRSKYCAALDVSRGCAHGQQSLLIFSTSHCCVGCQARRSVNPPDAAMSLVAAGTVEIPDSPGSAFDQGRLNQRAAASSSRIWPGTVLRWLTPTPAGTWPRWKAFRKRRVSLQAKVACWSRTAAVPVWPGLTRARYEPGSS